MFGKTAKTNVKICQNIDASPYFWCNEAVLLEVKNGKGAIHWVRQEYDADYKASSALMLNKKPILQADLPGCPTCEGLLATGYGIENTDCIVLREIADKMNAPYAGITQAASTISPILGLLQDGMYILAECDVFPTDGNGHFFWNVPNKLTQSPATACQLTYIEDDFNCISSIPVYIYPSQSTDKFDPARIEYYQGLLEDRQHFPRAIAYHCYEFCSVLLDGHHKATACALNGETVPTLIIIPCTGVGYKPGSMKKMVEDKVNFCEIELPIQLFTGKQLDAIHKTMNQWRDRKTFHLKEYTLINKNWSPEYHNTAKRYPDVKELSKEIVLKTAMANNTDIDEWLKCAVGVNARKLESSILRYLRMDEHKAMRLALRCAKLNSDLDLMETAFKTLTLFKNNPDIEQLFIDWLIVDNDSHSVLRKIADNYWNEGDNT